jgi:hypothetical protein
MVGNLLIIFGIIVIGGGLYIQINLSRIFIGYFGDLGWAAYRGLGGVDVALVIIGLCLVSSGIIFRRRAREEEEGPPEPHL